MAEIKVPELAESITEGTIAQWLKQPGETVEKGEFIVELETDKVNVEVISEEAGVVQEHLAQEGDTVEVGQVIAIVGEGSGEAAAPKAEEAPQKSEEPAKTEAPATQEPVEKDPAAEEQSSSDRTIASPAARKLAREKGIDLAAITPVDPMGRVRVQDVEAHGSKPAASAPAAKAEAPKAAAPSSDEENGRIIREKMTRRRQTIAKRLLEVRQSTAMLTTFNEIDMTNVMALRSRKKDQFLKNNDVKLGFMSFFTKAVTAALKKYPYVNAELDGTDVLLKQFYDVGIAVSTEEGLVVPIVRDTDKKNFAEIEATIGELATKARDKKLSIADMSGGSFTITNGGVFGSLMSTPILNGTQVGILGMHTIQKRPVAIGDEVQIRPMMYVALSYDHRVIDGSDSVGFLKMVKDMIENPEDLLLES
ncbi:2-oxoglutarate dehydrogenase complex dihydrolipoyllysine-residue succinyltransferase [Microbacterium sp. APC 3898]|uniref:Dihydrolipoyllysine-residue succinyltransferase component of 2-oxoglutarate dehydrogenase complex n=2 Tax=Planococcus TaxID=1372 RepID=A0ABT7ZGY3_9BACL|nr:MULTISPECIES: 2-oxoglutarate dehydrogenase complex dihydrolipoyllysine-residue succinyltransferase [Terrabacteria group]MBD8014172.1 2-oxoglutarate dehydrogenase complex dihydrolipoyllysine-residue succinyltransferase [Planococcus wigleyi]MDN3426415.1 2-oxoglutarate dehydrogenase complex dihydrolipoyllysine-residue succinyltransferase [Planococcus sp. APC 4016]MDN3438749.1 2-oxoglutarate dehydrogenase complex dihydrolipoyllysine-residue succinyltransferase [Planococcus sp. APC 3900]MDN349811